MPTPNDSIDLSAEQIDSFHRDGFLAIERVTTNAEIAALRPIFDETFFGWRDKPEFAPRDLAGRKGEADEGRVLQMHDISKNVPAFAESIMRRNAISIAAQLLGAQSEFRTDHAISKPSGSLAETAWHQDQFYWDPANEYRRVTIWMPLQDVDEKSGCMHFVSRQHVPDIIPHHKQDRDPNSHAWDADRDFFDTAVAAPCPLAAGGATVHYGKTLHFTTGNRSTEPRRAYIVSCGDPASEVEYDADKVRALGFDLDAG
jgi:ectoine hydroxylase-related dioxygenase (phytanoyl-CoA dioxygenase family)